MFTDAVRVAVFVPVDGETVSHGADEFALQAMLPVPRLVTVSD